MNNQLNFNAIMAWAAFGAQDYYSLERHGGGIYGYFIHSPDIILYQDSPLLIGKVSKIYILDFNNPKEVFQ